MLYLWLVQGDIGGVQIGRGVVSGMSCAFLVVVMGVVNNVPW